MISRLLTSNDKLVAAAAMPRTLERGAGQKVVVVFLLEGSREVLR